MTTVREHLDALGFTSDDHDANVREALLELRHARLSLAEFRKEREDEARDMGDGKIIVSYDEWRAGQRAQYRIANVLAYLPASGDDPACNIEAMLRGER